MSITLKQLQAFVTVADLGGFRRAADRLNTTQPTISARVAELEAHLDTRLLDRDAGATRLTAKGRALIAHAREVIAARDRLIAATGDGALVQGSLRLGVTELVAHTWLRAFLNALNDRFPNLLPELTVDLSANLETALGDGSLDIAFQNGPFQRTLSGTVPLGDYPLVWVAAPGLSADPKRLTDHPILVPARNAQPYDQIAAYLDGQTPPARLVPSANLATNIQMAVDGMGVALAPEAMVARELASGELTALKTGWLPSPLSFAARFDTTRGPGVLADVARLAAQIAKEDRKNQS